ncbi:hypothetical protein PRIPAC_86038 [Pristionchus pacificus]|nr:hypothetical protein PRIPAC_86038 [Pristionchus pacificus]
MYAQILSLLIGFLYTVQCSCPPGFELASQGECRGVTARTVVVYTDDALNTVKAYCDTVNGQVPIIHNEEQNSYWLSQQNDRFLLGLKCNSSTKKWEWMDGTDVDFKPEKYSQELDGECCAACSWWIYTPGDFLAAILAIFFRSFKNDNGRVLHNSIATANSC